MTQPRPKFAVGELVRTKSCNGIGVENESDKTEVLNVKWIPQWKGEHSPGWGYKTDSMPESMQAVIENESSHWWFEEELYKLPPKDRTKWEDSVFVPNSVRVK